MPIQIQQILKDREDTFQIHAVGRPSIPNPSAQRPKPIVYHAHLILADA